MKKIYITIFILVLILLIVIIGFVLFKKKKPTSDQTTLLTQIQRFMNILSTTADNWFCVSDQNVLKNIEDTYSTIVTSYSKISLDLNIDPALTQAYNDLVTKYQTDITFPFCSDYCNEATFDSSKNICVCRSGLTPIESSGKIYCSTQDCSSMTNSHFDPISHSCQQSFNFTFSMINPLNGTLFNAKESDSGNSMLEFTSNSGEVFNINESGEISLVNNPTLFLQTDSNSYLKMTNVGVNLKFIITNDSISTNSMYIGIGDVRGSFMSPATLVSFKPSGFSVNVVP